MYHIYTCMRRTLASAINVFDRTISSVDTPNIFFALYTPLLLKISLAMGTVEFTCKKQQIINYNKFW